MTIPSKSKSNPNEPAHLIDSKSNEPRYQCPSTNDAAQLPPSSLVCMYDREIDLTDLASWEPSLADIVRGLSQINRFNGQTMRPYSVAAHSVKCLHVLSSNHDCTDPEILLAMLLHDAAEAYIGDIIRPIKQSICLEVYPLEEAVMLKIYNYFGITPKTVAELNTPSITELFHEIDTRMAVTEADQLLNLTILPDIPRYDISIPISTPLGDRERFNGALQHLTILRKQRSWRL